MPRKLPGMAVLSCPRAPQKIAVAGERQRWQAALHLFGLPPPRSKRHTLIELGGCFVFKRAQLSSHTLSHRPSFFQKTTKAIRLHLFEPRILDTPDVSRLANHQTTPTTLPLLVWLAPATQLFPKHRQSHMSSTTPSMNEQYGEASSSKATENGAVEGNGGFVSQAKMSVQPPKQEDLQRSHSGERRHDSHPQRLVRRLRRVP